MAHPANDDLRHLLKGDSANRATGRFGRTGRKVDEPDIICKTPRLREAASIARRVPPTLAGPWPSALPRPASDAEADRAPVRELYRPTRVLNSAPRDRAQAFPAEFTPRPARRNVYCQTRWPHDVLLSPQASIGSHPRACRLKASKRSSRRPPASATWRTTSRCSSPDSSAPLVAGRPSTVCAPGRSSRPLPSAPISMCSPCAPAHRVLHAQ